MAARVTAKKAAAKKPAQQKRAVAVRSASAPFEPLRLSSTPATPPEMVDLFQVDDTMYQVPLRPSASIGLKYLEAIEQVGEQAATLYLMREMLGDGYEALANCQTLEQGQLQWVAETVIGLVLGTVEAPKG